MHGLRLNFCRVDLDPFARNGFKGISSSLGPLRFFLLTGYAWINTLRFLRSGLVPHFSRLLQSEGRIRAEAQQAFLAIVFAVFHFPVLAAGRIDLQKQAATIKELVHFIFGLGITHLGGGQRFYQFCKTLSSFIEPQHEPLQKSL